MARYTILILFWSFLITPIQAQIEKCEILHLKDAIVICEFTPLSPFDTTYVEGDHYICYDGKTVFFEIYADNNSYLISDHESNVNIPECLTNGEENKAEDKYVHWLTYDYSYNLQYSEYERRVMLRGIVCKDCYKRAGKKNLYVAYAFEGDIVMYKMRKKIVIEQGFKDDIYVLKPKKSSRFAVLKKADKLRSLTMEEAKSLRLKKNDKSFIHLYVVE